MRRLLLLTCFVAVAASGDEGAIDERTGLVIDDGWVYVSAHCGACHSYALVTSQRGDASFWRETIRWMQRTQRLWTIPEEQEQALIAYLAKHYRDTEWGRRAALPEDLLPPPASR